MTKEQLEQGQKLVTTIEMADKRLSQLSNPYKILVYTKGYDYLEVSFGPGVDSTVLSDAFQDASDVFCMMIRKKVQEFRDDLQQQLDDLGKEDPKPESTETEDDISEYL